MPIARILPGRRFGFEIAGVVKDTRRVNLRDTPPPMAEAAEFRPRTQPDIDRRKVARNLPTTPSAIGCSGRIIQFGSCCFQERRKMRDH
jgi:hypothetical protein